MKHIWNCRRTGMAFLSILSLSIALFMGHDTSSAIAAVAIGLAGANAAEKSLKKEVQ